MIADKINFNFVKLNEEEENFVDSIITYTKMIGYSVDYVCLFENNLKDKYDSLFFNKGEKDILLLFAQDKKIKLKSKLSEKGFTFYFSEKREILKKVSELFD